MDYVHYRTFINMLYHLYLDVMNRTKNIIKSTR